MHRVDAGADSGVAASAAAAVAQSSTEEHYNSCRMGWWMDESQTSAIYGTLIYYGGGTENRSKRCVNEETWKTVNTLRIPSDMFFSRLFLFLWHLVTSCLIWTLTDAMVNGTQCTFI